MFLILSCSCLCPNHCIQVFSWEWRCSWSSTDRRCSNYIWVINNFLCLLRHKVHNTVFRKWFHLILVWCMCTGDLICNVTVVSGVIRCQLINCWYVATKCLESYQSLGLYLMRSSLSIQVYGEYSPYDQLIMAYHLQCAVIREYISFPIGTPA